MLEMRYWFRRSTAGTIPISTRLQTCIPGISFSVKGRVWYQQAGDDSRRLMSKRAVWAAARAGVYDAARLQARNYPPENAYEAEQSITVRLAQFQSVKDYPQVLAKANLRLSLTGEDAVKAERFQEARREGRLEEALSLDHMAFLRKEVLANQSSATLWWVYRNLNGSEPATSWEVFDTILRPLITHEAVSEEPVAKITATMTTLMKHINEDPSRLDQLVTLSDRILKLAGESKVADEFATVNGQGQRDQQEESPGSLRPL